MNIEIKAMYYSKKKSDNNKRTKTAEMKKEFKSRPNPQTETRTIKRGNYNARNQRKKSSLGRKKKIIRLKTTGEVMGVRSEVIFTDSYSHKFSWINCGISCKSTANQWKKIIKIRAWQSVMDLIPWRRCRRQLTVQTDTKNCGDFPLRSHIYY